MRNSKKKHSQVANAKLGACVLWLRSGCLAREMRRCAKRQPVDRIPQACAHAFVGRIATIPWLARHWKVTHTPNRKRAACECKYWARRSGEKEARTVHQQQKQVEKEKATVLFSLTLLEIIAAHAPNSSAGEEGAEIFDCFLPIRPRIRGPNLPSSSGPRSHACGATGLRLNWPLKN